jgi:Zn finger protein HypA/HybF involved in hydrogenase expression
MNEDEVMVGIRCTDCDYNGVILSELEDTACPDCEPGTLRETSVLASEG